MSFDVGNNAASCASSRSTVLVNAGLLWQRDNASLPKADLKAATPPQPPARHMWNNGPGQHSCLDSILSQHGYMSMVSMVSMGVYGV